MSTAITLCALALTAQADPTSKAPDLGAALDAWAKDAVAAGHLSGSVLVARGQEILVERHWGFANRELSVPNGRNTRYCIASITKPITGVVALRMLDEGLIAADSKLDQFIPDFPRGDEITLEMLLNHRAGIPHRPLDRADVHVPRSAKEVAEAAATRELLFEPGTDSNYSTGGYSVLARALEVAGGADYDTLVQRYVAEPLKLESTRHVSDREILAGRATSYAFGPGGMRHTEQQDTSYLVGGGSIYSNPRDLFRFATALVRGDLGETAQASYRRRDGFRWNGVTDGFRAFADRHLDDDLYVIFCGNVHSGATDALRNAVPVLARGEEVEALVVPKASEERIPDEKLQRVAGVYELRAGSELTVRVEDGALVINDWLLVPESESTFFSPQDYGRIELRLDDDGAVQGLDWAIGGQSNYLPKVRDA